MRVPEATCTGNATEDRFDSSSNQTQSFGDFHHGTSRLLSRLETKLTYSFSYHHRREGTTSLPWYWRRGALVRQARDPFRSLANWKRKHNLCLLPFLSTPTTTPTSPCRNRKERRSLQSILIDNNGTPATWTLVLSSSKPLTGRTGLQTEGRFSLLEPLVHYAKNQGF